jgi:hypothetical protein
VVALPAMPPIGAVMAVCHTNLPTLEVLDCAFKSLLTHSIEEAIFSAHALNFSHTGASLSLTGVQGKTQSSHFQALRVRKEPTLPSHRIAPVTAP